MVIGSQGGNTDRVREATDLSHCQVGPARRRGLREATPMHDRDAHVECDPVFRYT